MFSRLRRKRGALQKPPANWLSPVPARDVKKNRPKFVSHENFWTWFGSVTTDPATRVLEVGSRSVASDALWNKVSPDVQYVGFDYMQGKNVNVVGDAHDLSSYFDAESFDVVISCAVFEHLAMPWLVVEEISKVLAVGGQVGVVTHFSFSEHELPWNFFQFHHEGLKHLFCPELGFEVEDAGLSTPMVGWMSNQAAPELVGRRVRSLYCHSSVLARKTRTVLTKDCAPFDWRSTLDRLRTQSSYPKNSGMR